MGCVATIGQKSPAPSLACLEAHNEFRNLEQWLMSTETLAMPMHEVEAEQLIRSREVNRQLLQAHVRARGDGDVGPRLALVVKESKPASTDECEDGCWPGTGVAPSAGTGPGAAEAPVFLRGHLHAREIQTVFGNIDVDRRAYCRPGHQSLHPSDQSWPCRSALSLTRSSAG